MLTTMLDKLLAPMDSCPWGGAVGRHAAVVRPAPLYTPAERRRRDETRWTLVQGILAPLQFAVFLLSLAFVLRTLLTGEGETAAIASVVIKTIVLYVIMVTGAIWEREVFGRYLFAPAFYWEDMFSMLVLALHTAYLAAWYSGALGTHGLMLLALVAYATYVFNAGQFVMKLRMARRDMARQDARRWVSPAGIDSGIGLSA